MDEGECEPMWTRTSLTNDTLIQRRRRLTLSELSFVFRVERAHSYFQDGCENHCHHQRVLRRYHDDCDCPSFGNHHAVVSVMPLYKDLGLRRSISDRVLVMDKGQVLEYGRPRDLVAEGASAFRALCMAQGLEEFEKLVQMANEE